ncbi:amino acid ABC transporter permease [Methylobacterium sp. E-005]|uniref:amino acid ABC transporter permease n=1 Tax=Methylobacterium sp. E-005 TaxID=2836549 RepID=UPI001FB9654C|nr:amino acid ABC transporter permease [Methylobacterium sp. E-005]MCJ2088878.1 amino acid ABC transporter permease [Methylobacterium sp. E-005]
MNPAVITDNLGYLLFGAWPDGPVDGLALTPILSILSGLASAALGLVLGIGLAMSTGMERRALVLRLGFRAIPVVMLIFWSYFLLPILFGVSVPEIGTVVTARSLVGGAYLAYGVEAGIEGIGQGQWAAGLALGFGHWQVLRVIVLPQALRAMVPSCVNQWTALTKDTSLAYLIGVPELSFVAAQVNNRAMVYPTEIFLVVGTVSGALCLALDRLAALAQGTRRASRSSRGTPAEHPGVPDRGRGAPPWSTEV